MLALAAVALALWLALLLVPWQPWRCRERLEPDQRPTHSRDFTVLIPARDEAGVIAATLAGLAAAAPDAPVILIDDESGDGTAAVARASPHPHLSVLTGDPRPSGWAGKLWALEQGLQHVTTPRVLLLDADIRLAAGMIAALERKASAGFALVSVLAEPRFEGFWAHWLLPAFVYFFKLLYPFALANSARPRIAAAAGGVVLVERKALAAAGGFSAWRSAIIDDCTLAARIKAAGYRTWVGMTRGALSLRHQRLSSIVDMVARSAYVQLRESPLLLLAMTLLMMLCFWVPPVALARGGATAWLGLATWAALAIAYVPTLRYYRLGVSAAILMPLTATAYLAMTWYSAIRSQLGIRSVWKGRRYLRSQR